jgi:hypothetical protein
MYAPDLALVEQAESAPDPTTGSSDAAIVAQPTSLIPPANAQPTARPVVVVPLPTQAIAQPTALPRQALTVAVQILNAHDAPQPGLRVQLIDVFGAVLREGSTDEHGQISLVADLSASAAVWVQVPALGLTVPVDRAKPTVAIVVPG